MGRNDHVLCLGNSNGVGLLLAAPYVRHRTITTADTIQVFKLALIQSVLSRRSLCTSHKVPTIFYRKLNLNIAAICGNFSSSIVSIVTVNLKPEHQSLRCIIR